MDTSCNDFVLAGLRTAPFVNPKSIANNDCRNGINYIAVSYEKLDELHKLVLETIRGTARALVNQVHAAATIARAASNRAVPPSGSERARAAVYRAVPLSSQRLALSARRRRLAEDFKAELGKYGADADVHRAIQANLACSLSLYHHASGRGDSCVSKPPQSCFDELALSRSSRETSSQIVEAAATAQALCLQTACANKLESLEDSAVSEQPPSSCRELAKSVNATCVAAAETSNGAWGLPSNSETTAHIGGAVSLAEHLCERSVLPLTKLGSSQYSTEDQRRAVAEQMIHGAPRSSFEPGVHNSGSGSYPFKTQLEEAQKAHSGLKPTQNEKQVLINPDVQSLLRILEFLNGDRTHRALSPIAKELVEVIVYDSYEHNAGGLLHAPGEGESSFASAVKDFARGKGAVDIGSKILQRTSERQIDAEIMKILIEIATATLLHQESLSSSYEEKVDRISKLAATQVPAPPLPADVRLLEERLHNARENSAKAYDRRLFKVLSTQSVVEGARSHLGGPEATTLPSAALLADLSIRATKGVPATPQTLDDIRQLVEGQKTVPHLLWQHITNKMSGAIDEKAEASTYLNKLSDRVFGNPFETVFASPVLIKDELLTIARDHIIEWIKVNEKEFKKCYGDTFNDDRYFLMLEQIVDLLSPKDNSERSNSERALETEAGDKTGELVLGAYKHVFKSDVGVFTLRSVMSSLWTNATKMHDVHRMASEEKLRDALKRYLERVLFIIRNLIKEDAQQKCSVQFQHENVNLTNNVKQLLDTIESTQAPLLKDFKSWFGDVDKGNLVKVLLAALTIPAGVYAVNSLRNMAVHTPGKHLPQQVAHDLERAARGHSIQESVAKVLETVADEVPLNLEVRKSLQMKAQQLAHSLPRVSTEPSPGLPSSMQYTHGPHWLPWRPLHYPPVHAFPEGTFAHGAHLHLGGPPVHQGPYVYQMPYQPGAASPVGPAPGPPESFSGTLKSLAAGLGHVGGLGSIASLFGGLLGGDKNSQGEPEEDAELNAMRLDELRRGLSERAESQAQHKKGDADPPRPRASGTPRLIVPRVPRSLPPSPPLKRSNSKMPRLIVPR